MNEAATRIPGWYWAVATVGLLWNLLGVSMYLMLAYDHPAAAPQSAAEQQLQAGMPWWVMGAYAIAVFAGALGMLGLLLRRRWGKLLLAVSLAALLVQQLWVLVLSDALQVMDGTAAVSATVLIGSVLLLWFAHHADRRGWLR
jgi:hypothetical protein